MRPVHGVLQVGDEFHVVIPLLQVPQQRTVLPADGLLGRPIVINREHPGEHGAQRLLRKGGGRVRPPEKAARFRRPLHQRQLGQLIIGDGIRPENHDVPLFPLVNATANGPEQLLRPCPRLQNRLVLPVRASALLKNPVYHYKILQLHRRLEKLRHALPLLRRSPVFQIPQIEKIKHQRALRAVLVELANQPDSPLLQRAVDVHRPRGVGPRLLQQLLAVVKGGQHHVAAVHFGELLRPVARIATLRFRHLFSVKDPNDIFPGKIKRVQQAACVRPAAANRHPGPGRNGVHTRLNNIPNLLAKLPAYISPAEKIMELLVQKRDFLHSICLQLSSAGY